MKIFLGEVRSKKNITIRALAEKSGVAKSHIEKIEAGEANPTIEVMCRLAKALEIHVYELFSCE